MHAQRWCAPLHVYELPRHQLRVPLRRRYAIVAGDTTRWPPLVEMSSYKTYYSLPSKIKNIAKRYLPLHMIILEEQIANDIQQSTMVLWEGIGLNIELYYAVIDTAELILVGYRIICTKQQFRVLLQKYGCILNTQQQTLKRSTNYIVCILI